MPYDEIVQAIARLLPQGHLTKVQKIVLQQSWEGQSYLEIAREFGYDPGYIKDTGAKLWQQLSASLGEKVTKQNVRGVLERALWRQQHSQQSPALSAQPNITQPNITQPKIDWGEAIDVSVFYDRTQELATLQTWIMQDRCRLVALLGMGGMGKTSLSVKLAQELVGNGEWVTGFRRERQPNGNGEWVTENGTQGYLLPMTDDPLPFHPVTDDPLPFEFVIWRSLRNAPPLNELLADLLQFLSHQQISDLPPTANGKMSVLVSYFQQKRCLVVLDNFEAVLAGGIQAGGYNTGYEGYGKLLHQVGEITHQSCLMLTSREKPREVVALEGMNSKVRSFLITGLSSLAGQALFQDRGCTSEDQTVWERIVHHYSGNPLALKIVAFAIQELFSGNVDQVIPSLQQGGLKFGDITDLLDRQYERLTPAEQHIFYWLCINRESTSLSELEQDIVSETIQRQLLGILTSLVRRSLVERSEQGWFLQPVVMEYMSEKLVAQICWEITGQELMVFQSHALIKATAKDYVRQTQTRLFLARIVNQLIDQLGNQKSLEFYLNQILTQLRQKPRLPSNYAAGNLLNLLCYLKIDLTGYDFSQMTVCQAYLQDVNLPQVNFAGADLSRSVFRELFAGVITLAFSPDGRLLATADSRCEIQVWEVASGKHLITLKGHQSWVWSLVFSPDAQLLVSGSDDYSVKIWDLQTGQCLQTRKGPPNLLNAVVFANLGMDPADAQRVTIMGQDSTSWHPTLLAEHVEALQGRNFLVRSLTYSPDSQLLALSTHASTINLWNIQTGECYQTLKGHTDFARLLKFSPDGKTLASSNYDEEQSNYTPEIKIWDIKTGVCQFTLKGHTQLVNDFAFSSDGEWLASVSSDQTLKLWNVQTGECVKTFLGHSNRVLSVALAPDDRFLATGGDDRTIKLWDIHTGRCMKTFQGYTNAIYAMAMSSDRRVIATAHEDESIKLWNLETGKVFRTLRGHVNRVWGVAFPSESSRSQPHSSLGEHPQSIDHLLASAGADYTVKLWNWQTGECLNTLKGHTNWVWGVTFSPDGQLLASGSYDRTIKLWQVQTGVCVSTFQEQASAILPVLFTPDGQQLLSADYSGTIQQWDVQSGGCLQQWQAHAGRIFAIALHPNQLQLVSGGNDQQIRLWDLKTGQGLKTFPGHKAAVSHLCFTTNGQSLISASFDQTIKIWDMATGQCVQTLTGHQNVVSSVAVAANDTLLFSSSLDETIRLWDLRTGKCWQTLVSPRPYEGMKITGVTGLTDGQISNLKALGAG